jgi:5-hydroxyisourate hydrolase-like protein (transthyretin family)
MKGHVLRAALRCLAHPASLLSIGLLLLNDHVLKATGANWLTGKLSDFAGVFFFPFLLLAVAALPCALLARRRLPSRLLKISPMAAGGAAFALTALWFALSKATAAGNAATTRIASILVGGPVAIALDPTDLLALVMLWPAWRLWRATVCQPTPQEVRLTNAFAKRAGSWAALALAAVATMATSTPPLPPLSLIVLGHTSILEPGGERTLQIMVLNPSDGSPAADARVRVVLASPDRETQDLFAGETDADGMLTAHFRVPESVTNPYQRLGVLADTETNSATFRREVYVGRVYNILLSTDKPVYQPGQAIHIRALGLDALEMKPAEDQPLQLAVHDAQGNQLMRREVTTSRWGIAATDFALDAQAASGDYTISASLGPVTSKRTVEVKPYRLPRFEITLASDRDFYLPGDQAGGAVDAAYFFGKPVAGGAVRILGFVTDVERRQIFELTGETDAAGAYRYAFVVPEQLTATLETNTADIELEVTVTDTAGHSESISESLPVAAQPMIVEAIPESGILRPGIENIVYLQVSYPDGAGARAELEVRLLDARGTPETPSPDEAPTAAPDETATAAPDETPAVVPEEAPTAVPPEPIHATTDEYGLATITLTPESGQNLVLEIAAADGEGREARQVITLSASAPGEAILLRPERAEYQIGETLNVDAYVTGHVTTVYLDIVKEGQTFGLVALPVEEGAARASIDIDGSLLGTLELHAYAIDDRGELVTDHRLVLVNPAPGDVDVAASAEVYRPGETARLAITARRNGQPMPGVLGISIVDESVFSVESQDPGFARTYFLVNRELLEPRYEIHDFTSLGNETSPYDREYEGVYQTAAAVQDAREAALFGLMAEELAAAGENAGVATGRSNETGGLFGALALIPIVGLAAYDGCGGRQSKQRWLIIMGLLALAASLLLSCAAPAAAPAPPMVGEAALVAFEEKPTTESQPPRLRQFFPETLFWLPDLETDADGRAEIEVPIADSITTWRVSILASDRDGNLGSAETGLRVFQDFFIEPDLPRFLTQGDEIAVPVSVYNYRDEPQEVRLEVAPAGWFEFIEGDPGAGGVAPMQVGANEVAGAYIPIRVTGFGVGQFKVTATGSEMSDAVLREVEILPDGLPVAAVESGRLQPEQIFRAAIPEASIRGTERIALKIFPGIVSQVIQGLEGMLQVPHGCFEQTSSTTYPNVLVLDYLRTTEQASPEVEIKAEAYISQGYQRLLTFEVADTPGGFSLFGEPPAKTTLTAYGLMEFSDMSRVAFVDPALAERTAAFLIGQQASDGSWDAYGMANDTESSEERMPTTAYVAWALGKAGQAQGEAVQKASGFIKENLTTNANPYVLALAANALLEADSRDPFALELLDSLAAQAKTGVDGAYWSAEMATYTGGRDQVADIETTALAAMALMKADQHRELAQHALDFLIGQMDSDGGFHTTQATVLALQALLMGAKLGAEGSDATVNVVLDERQPQALTITQENFNVVQEVQFDDLAAGEEHEISVAVVGERRLNYQVVTEYYVPWEKVAPQAVTPDKPALHMEVSYDRTELVTGETVKAEVRFEIEAPGEPAEAGMLLVDVGVPPGFDPLTEDLEALVNEGMIDRYELTERQILFYLSDVPSGEPHRLDYRLRARFPVEAQAPASQAYDYYTPAQRDLNPPQRFKVRLNTSTAP